MDIQEGDVFERTKDHLVNRDLKTGKLFVAAAMSPSGSIVDTRGNWHAPGHAQFVTRGQEGNPFKVGDRVRRVHTYVGWMESEHQVGAEFTVEALAGVSGVYSEKMLYHGVQNLERVDEIKKGDLVRHPDGTLATVRSASADFVGMGDGRIFGRSLVEKLNREDFPIQPGDIVRRVNCDSQTHVVGDVFTVYEGLYHGYLVDGADNPQHPGNLELYFRSAPVEKIRKDGCTFPITSEKLPYNHAAPEEATVKAERWPVVKERVEFIGDEWEDSPAPKGSARVESISSGTSDEGYRVVKFYEDEETYAVSPDHYHRIRATGDVMADWEVEILWGKDQTTEIAPEPEANPVRPNHYKFPSGVEVRDISSYLTSNGGQAVQYVARATRLDGDVKGSPVEDLKKALKFIEWEIERLENTGE